jgi:hypothetical protein
MQLFIQLHQTQSWWIPLPRYQLLLPVWDMVCSSHMAISFFVFACDRCFPWFMSGRQTDLIWSDLHAPKIVYFLALLVHKLYNIHIEVTCTCSSHKSYSEVGTSFFYWILHLPAGLLLKVPVLWDWFNPRWFTHHSNCTIHACIPFLKLVFKINIYNNSSRK